MDNWKLYGLILAVACIMMFAPVAACHPILSKTGPQFECPTCEYFEYTITARASDPVAALRVQDTLPSGLTFVSSTPAPTSQSGQTLTWVFTTGLLTDKTITVRVKPTTPTVSSVSNYVSGSVKLAGTSAWTEYRDTSQTPVVTTFDREMCTEAPEFPSTVIPAAMIIGFLGTVLFIRKTKE
jgi:uncharacterized repeat protein (TIGR01451 family)